jgi:hypothetical protein
MRINIQVSDTDNKEIIQVMAKDVEIAKLPGTIQIDPETFGNLFLSAIQTAMKENHD